MAAPPLLTLSDLTLGFGGTPLLQGASLTVAPGERLGLVGRNGSGKSTLLKIMAGLVEPDAGQRFVPPGRAVAYMEQDPEFGAFATLGDFVRHDFDAGEEYRAEIAMDGVKLDGSRPVAAASGGERRRAALARIMASDADLLLLDEPTNHLDIEMIAWLERELSETRRAFVLISHDRAFLRALTRAMLWVDRGQVRRLDRGFDAFEDWRDKTYEEEDEARHKLNRLIKAESRWAVEGISGRRKRNMGRVRRLQDMRTARASEIRRAGTADLALETGSRSGKLVVEAEGVSKRFGERVIVREFDLRIQRGDRVALVGPNGVGKTSLLNLLIGKDCPDTGRIRLGTNLQMAVFDQNRAQLDPDVSLWDSLAHDPELGVRGRNDQVMVRGAPRHVVGYLKDFLFSEAQVRSPVRALSGGEKARLLLARILAKESNFLVLDEPTNDLDVETLDLLQELIDDYDGTVLLVSHDRDFLDRVATLTVHMEGRGRATVYAGGWSDMLAQRGPPEPVAEETTPRAKPAAAPAPKPRPRATGLTQPQQHRLARLPAEIERLEAEIAKLEQFLSDPELYTRAPARFAKATEALAERQAALAAAEEEWLELEALREASG
ncbi:ATP-binding cassette domain-containing protein [Rhodobacteraceae bacterium 2CG4]|uniref:ATP-binding cassette domain-containing protein n=1 Tax=Halovulum marinum TaxID=2662447 RepID=A0A6L5Z011_9RHOB|nr:ABC-F family ATP-binding cassette domain-containing protein [Halovulum marinum]MSU89906.1 ATP-binding cassette domain-containing protein [Halovulum marinum]